MIDRLPLGLLTLLIDARRAAGLLIPRIEAATKVASILVRLLRLIMSLTMFGF